MKPRMRILIVTAALLRSTGLATPAVAVDQHSGFPYAKKRTAKGRDRQAREATGAQAAALEQFNRGFVASVRDTGGAA
jgi:hypothetical protein